MKQIIYLISWAIAVSSCQAQDSFQPLDNDHSVIFLDSISAAKEISEDHINGFFDKISLIDMSIQMKNKCEELSSCREAYLDYLRKDVASFTEDEIKTLRPIYKKAYEEIAKINKGLIPKEVQLIKTKANHYGPSVYYTRENCIVIPENELTNPNMEAMLQVTYHELFHIISRYNPQLKDELYGHIGFKKLQKKVELPKQLKDRLLLNPDGIEMEHYIVLMDTAQKKSSKTIPLIISTETQFNPDKPAFFAYLKFDMYDLKEENQKLIVRSDNSGYSTFSLKDAPSFFEQIKDNTGYIIHPDEIMADNFTLVFMRQSKEELSSLSVEGRELLKKVKNSLQNFNTSGK